MIEHRKLNIDDYYRAQRENFEASINPSSMRIPHKPKKDHMTDLEFEGGEEEYKKRLNAGGVNYSVDKLRHN